MKKILLIICIAFAQIGLGQTESLEIWIGSMNSANIPGPIQTTETENLKATASGDNSGITVTGAFGDQQYTGIVIGSQPAINGLEFGIKDNSLSGTKSWQEDAVGVRFNSVGTPSSSYFTSPTGTASGISTFSNGAFNISTNVPEALTNGTDSGDGLYYAGTITYTFNKPVDYPILHVTGLGAIFDAPELGSTLVWHTQYEATGGLTFTKLSGTTHTLLDNGDTKIYNDWTTDQYESTGDFGTDADFAGTGSFRVEGEDITSFTMNVYAKGTRAVAPWNVTGNTATKVFNNDRHTQSWTVETFTFNGSVVIDNKQNGKTGPEDGVLDDGSPVSGGPYTGGGLFAVLVDESGNVAAKSPVSTSDGSFSFPGVIGDDYKVILSTTEPTVGDVAPTVATLPAGYKTTEEEFINDTPTTDSADGTNDSVTNVYNVNYSNVGDINTNNLILGISQDNVVLPIELGSFTAEAEGLDAMLDWETLSEVDNKHFIVERSIDGVNFEEILTPIASQSVDGFSQDPLNYSVVDKGVAEWLAVNSPSTVVYYRIKQVDFDGTVHYPSATRPVDFDDAEIPSKLFPNPVSVGQNATVQMEGITKVEVYTLNGQLVKVIEETTPVKGTSIPTTDLSKGAYMVVINGGKAMKLIVK